MKTFITIKIILIGLLVILALTPKNDPQYSSKCEVTKAVSTKKTEQLLDTLLIEKKQFDKKFKQVIKNK